MILISILGAGNIILWQYLCGHAKLYTQLVIIVQSRHTGNKRRGTFQYKQHGQANNNTKEGMHSNQH